MSFLAEFWAFPAERKKYWLIPIFFASGFRRPYHLNARIGRGSIHLYPVLIGYANSWYFRILS